MKKLLIYIFLSSLVGCNEPEEWIGNGSGYSKYLVQNYVDGSYVLYGMLAEKPSTLYSMSGFQVLLEDPVYYQTPEQERGRSIPTIFFESQSAITIRNTTI